MEATWYATLGLFTRSSAETKILQDESVSAPNDIWRPQVSRFASIHFIKYD